MAEELERIYTVPLRNAALAPRPKRAKRAVTEVKLFLARHMKADEEKIWIDNPVNEIIWSRGIQKPPSRLRVRAIKFEDGVVEVSLPETESPKRLREEEERRKAEEAEKAKAEAASPAPTAGAALAEPAPEEAPAAATQGTPAAAEGAPAGAPEEGEGEAPEEETSEERAEGAEPEEETADEEAEKPPKSE